tara:strand:+ start:5637 stop:6656 length:1020 start_codon:yes stop_codon:yes gene_type:complete
MKNKVTISDLAKRTNLSTTTVSRVLNGKSEKYRISKKSQNIIKRAALDLNYVANHFASTLKSGKSSTLGIIVPSLLNPFFARIASKINTEVRKYGFTTIIAESSGDIEVEKKDLKKFISKNVEGLIIIPCGKETHHIKSNYDNGLPIVLLDRYLEGSQIPYVSSDDYEGAYMGTKLLIDHGHKNITCIQGVIDSSTNKERVNGFKSAMSDAGIRNIKIVGDAFSIENGYLETKMLLQNKTRPTAIFTLGNTIAFGCIKALKDENVQICDDISIITYDDNIYLDYLSTPITSIAQPVDIICKMAMKKLMSSIREGNKLNTSGLILKPEIKYRESISRINV